MSNHTPRPANHPTRLIVASRKRRTEAGVDLSPIPSEVIGAYGERVAARLLRARVVSGPKVDDHDLIANGRKIEVKTSLSSPKHIGDLRKKVRDRVVFVELQVIDGQLCAEACSFYEQPGKNLGRRPGRIGFLRRAARIDLRRPIRLSWRVAASTQADGTGSPP